MTTKTLAQTLLTDTVGALGLAPVCFARERDSVRMTLGRMNDLAVGCALVVDEAGRLAGQFTERDFLRKIVSEGRNADVPLAEVMSKTPWSVTSRESVRTVIERMEASGDRHLPVVDDEGKPVGVLSIKDLMHYFVEFFPANVYNLPPDPKQTMPSREGA